MLVAWCGGRSVWTVLATALMPPPTYMTVPIVTLHLCRPVTTGVPTCFPTCTLTPTLPPTPPSPPLQFDVFVVIVSIMTVLVDYLFPLSPQALQLVRVLRVARIFKLVPKIKGLRMMFLTFVWSLPALFNVGSVTFILMYIYAVSWGAGGRCGKGVNRCGARGCLRSLTWAVSPSSSCTATRTGRGVGTSVNKCSCGQNCIDLRPFATHTLMGPLQLTHLAHL